MSRDNIRALALFSGGLDSILSCRVIMEQGIEVIAVRYVTPFFGYELLAREKEYAAETREKYGIDLLLRDVSGKYLAMLGNPPHGYGKNFNPCVDCKILLAAESRAMMHEIGASFIISGEVLGQRPMSQRRDTLRVIERDSGCEDLLLRPLCARNMTETLPERIGMVDRGRLHGFSGRSRAPQIELAASFGITDFPSPAGGCVLTDPILAARIAAFYQRSRAVSVSDARLLQIGRHYYLPGGGWLVMGRDEGENSKILALGEPGDLVLETVDWPGPSGLLRGGTVDDHERAAGLLIRFSRKGTGRSGASVALKKISTNGNAVQVETAKVPPLSDQLFEEIAHPKR
ncbi:MAG: thiamine biosynthesis protein [Proteobacteria bacterium]|nr:thiamine biosynthesis protein [Pseudomonadota bacterium]MBU1738707.1 thiamine biosynthesis protein [Pseudomonadota bacterium]